MRCCCITLCIESLRLFTTLSCFHVTIHRGHWGLLHTVSSHTVWSKVPEINKLITTSAHQGLTWLLLSDHPLFSWPHSTDLLPNPEVLWQFFDWLRQLVHKCGGKNVYFNDRSIIKDAFEGFPRGGLEKLNTWYEMLQHLIYHLLHQYITSNHRASKACSRMQLCFSNFLTGSVT